MLYGHRLAMFRWLSSMSERIRHLRLLPQCVYCIAMTSTVIRSQSNRAPLVCGWTADLRHECSADCSICLMLSSHDTAERLGKFLAPCWIQIMKNLGDSNVKTNIRKVYLIKSQWFWLMNGFWFSHDPQISCSLIKNNDLSLKIWLH